MVKKVHQKLIATVLAITMLFSNVAVSAPVFAAGEDDYPTKTTNKDDVVTIEKSTEWNGVNAQQAEYNATVHLKATGIQKVVKEMEAVNPADIILVLDKSGSLAACNHSEHVGDGVMFKADGGLTASANTAALNALQSYSTSSSDKTKWIVPVSGLSDADKQIYLTPIKNSATTSSLTGWGIFGFTSDYKTHSCASLFTTPSTVLRTYPVAPYFVGHFALDDNGDVVEHIAEVKANGDIHYSDPIQTGSGWTTHSEAVNLPGSVDFRSTLTAEKNDFDCELVFGTARDSSIQFVSKMIDQYGEGDLAKTSTLSVIPFSGSVDNTYLTNPTDLSTANLKATVTGQINDAYKSLGYQTNWGDTMADVASKLNAMDSSRQKFVIFFTDGVPDMGDEGGDDTQANLAKALAQAQSLYDSSTNNKMYGIFLNSKGSDYQTLCRMVNAMNTNQPGDTSASGYALRTQEKDPAAIAKELEKLYDEILTYLEKWSKSTQIVSIDDTISKYYTIDKSKLSGTEGKDWVITTTADGREKITFYTSINGFSTIDKIEQEVPLILKDIYRDDTKYYPTNEGNANCNYKDIEGADVKVGTATPYLPVDIKDNEKAVISINGEEATEGDGVSVGDVIEYKLQVINGGHSAATITITDKLPTGTEFVSAEDGGVNSNGTVTWTKSDVGAGETFATSFKVRVTAEAQKTIENSAVVKIGDNSHTTNVVTNPLDTKEILSINDKDADVGDIVTVGDIINYQINYNTSKTDAEVIVTDKVPSGTEFVSAEDGGVHKDGVVAWNLGEIKADTQGHVSFKVRVTKDAETVVKNIATVKIGDRTNKTNIIYNPLTKKALLSINGEKASEGDIVTVGDEVKYSIAYANVTDKPQDIKITDVLPSGTEFVSANKDGALASNAVDPEAEGDQQDNIVTWNLEGVEANSEGTVELVVKVTDAAKFKIENMATVTIGNQEKDTNIIVNPLIKKTFASANEEEGTTDGDLVTVGDKITYSISYANVTDQPVDITITDKIPAGTEFVAADQGGVHKKGVVTWTLKDVEPNSEGAVELTVEVTDKAVTKIENTATVTIGDNERETNQVVNPVVKKSIISINNVKASNGDSVKVGDSVKYSISYANVTDKPVDIIITDKVPAGTEFVSANKDGKLEKTSDSKKDDTVEDENTSESDADAKEEAESKEKDETDGGTVVWTLKDVEPGTEGTVELVVKVTDAAKDKIINVATVQIGDKKVETNKIENPLKDATEKTDPKEGGSTDKENNDSANTGDDFNLMMWMSMAIAALGCCAFYSIYTARKRNIALSDVFSSLWKDKPEKAVKSIKTSQIKMIDNGKNSAHDGYDEEME